MEVFLFLSLLLSWIKEWSSEIMSYHDVWEIQLYMDTLDMLPARKGKKTEWKKRVVIRINLLNIGIRFGSYQTTAH